MPRLERSLLLPHAASDMFALVQDIEAYPQFLPGCVLATIESVQGNETRASLGFALKGLQDRFTTINRAVSLLDTPVRIEMELMHGPFRRLRGEWAFTPLDAQASKVCLSIDIEFGNRMMEGVLTPVLGRSVAAIMDAFRRRAELLYADR